MARDRATRSWEEGKTQSRYSTGLEFQLTKWKKFWDQLYKDESIVSNTIAYTEKLLQA